MLKGRRQRLCRPVRYGEEVGTSGGGAAGIPLAPSAQGSGSSGMASRSLPIDAGVVTLTVDEAWLRLRLSTDPDSIPGVMDVDGDGDGDRRMGDAVRAQLAICMDRRRIRLRSLSWFADRGAAHAVPTSIHREC